MTLQKIEFVYDIPDGYRFVKYDVPKKNEYYLINGNPIKSVGCNTVDYPIVEKIPKQEQSKPQPELKLQYKTQQGDWRDVNDGYEYRIKPRTRIVRFRNYITNEGAVKITVETMPNDFKQWLGDWQEVEIEEND